MLEMIIIIEGRMGHEIKITRDSLEINRVEKDFSYADSNYIIFSFSFLLSRFCTCSTFVWFLKEKINMKKIPQSSPSHITAINSFSK